MTDAALRTSTTRKKPYNGVHACSIIVVILCRFAVGGCIVRRVQFTTHQLPQGADRYLVVAVGLFQDALQHLIASLERQADVVGFQEIEQVILLHPPAG